MAKDINKQKDPLIHIVKRDQITMGKTIGIKVMALLLAFIVSSILLAASEGCNPFTFLGSLFSGSFGSGLSIWTTLKDLAILLGLGLALLPAFKMKFWNIGADGQTLMGALTAYMCIYFWHGKMPDPLLCIISLIVAVLAGVIWAVIPAIFKAKWNTNETLFTLMMNYVAIQCVAIFINVYSTGGSNTLPVLYEGSLPMIHEYLMPILIIAALTVVVAMYIRHTKHGFELSLVGESINTAKYVGINVKKVVIRTLVLSGAICGLVGFILTNGLNHVVNTSSVGGKGFTAIIVVWLANFNPYYMILTAFMVVFLQRGTSELLTVMGSTNDSITMIITSIFIFFIIGCTFFSRYKLMFRRNEEDKIDNKFFAFLEKICIPVYNFFAMIYYGIGKGVKKIFKHKKKEETSEENITEENNEVKEEEKEEPLSMPEQENLNMKEGE